MISTEIDVELCVVDKCEINRQCGNVCSSSFYIVAQNMFKFEKNYISNLDVVSRFVKKIFQVVLRFVVQNISKSLWNKIWNSRTLRMFQNANRDENSARRKILDLWIRFPVPEGSSSTLENTDIAVKKFRVERLCNSLNQKIIHGPRRFVAFGFKGRGAWNQHDDDDDDASERLSYNQEGTSYIKALVKQRTER